MNIESVREYCLSLPHATEDFPFDETTLAFRIGGRIFAMIDLERTEWFVLKCNPDMAIELREKYAEIAPAWHMNKRHWISVLLPDAPDDVVQFLVSVSFEATKSSKKKSK